MAAFTVAIDSTTHGRLSNALAFSLRAIATSGSSVELAA